MAKVNPAGTALVYAGYIGGASYDYGYGIAVDGAGNAYVTGSTTSDQATFPVTGGPDLTFNGYYDAFVAKVNPAGTALLYAGYIGGAGDDEGYGIAVDGAGNAYVTGYTDSDQATFPVTRRAGPDLQRQRRRLRGEGQRGPAPPCSTPATSAARRRCGLRHRGGRRRQRLCHGLHRLRPGHLPRDSAGRT